LLISDIFLTISEVMAFGNVSSKIPKIEQEPSDYYNGLDLADRIISRRILMFERNTRQTLQQKHITNRMHHRYVLMIAVETAGEVSVDGKTLRLEPLQALLILPYQFHHYLDLESDQLRWIFVTFELEQGGASLRGLSHRVLQLDAAIEQTLVRLIQEWRLPARGQKPAILLPVVDQLLGQLFELGRIVEPRREHQEHSKESWVSQVENLLIQSIQSNWTLDQVAQRIGLSERQMRTRFEVATGVSLKDYRSDYQLHQVMALMRDSKLSLADISELTGFQSQPVFNRFIRRMTGLTPSKFRNQIVSM
jgi:AraC-like DNA-binding protein